MGLYHFIDGIKIFADAFCDAPFDVGGIGCQYHPRLMKM